MLQKAETFAKMGAWLISVWIAIASMGCGPAEPPIPDPGGPFKTTVPAGKTISGLTPDETTQLCSDLGTAYLTFLRGSVDSESLCREIGATAALESTDVVDIQATCQSIYDSCKVKPSPFAPGSCPFPKPGCHAAVELLSACLNEIAAATPVSLCVQFPSCEMIVKGQSIVEKPLPKFSDLPPMPACARLNRECPPLSFGYLCGTV